MVAILMAVAIVAVNQCGPGAACAPRKRIALVLHGRIGIWRTRSSHIDDANVVWLANAPHLWKKAPKTMAGIDLNASLHTTLIGFAAFGRGSLWQHVVAPNRAAGIEIGIFLHSWHAEIATALDAMYRPQASRHELVNRKLNSVQSQHLSMKTALGLMSDHEMASGRKYDLVMVTRFDILYFRPLLFSELGAGSLWLPHWCHRYPLDATSGMLVRAACGNWPGHGEGYMVHPATVAGIDPRMKNKVSRDADYDFAYLDWWFIATPAIAVTFGQIYDEYKEYKAGLERVAAKLAPWSHFFWGWHINRKLRMRRSVQYFLYEGVDFRLARHWHFGAHCMHWLGGGNRAPTGSGGGTAGPVATAAAAAAAAATAADSMATAAANLAAASSATGSTSGELDASAESAAQVATAAAAAAAAAASAVPGSALAALNGVGVDLSIYYRRRPKRRRSANETRQPAQLARQCPFDARVRLYCPWHSPVCPASMGETVLDAESAAQAAVRASSKLPTWSLYGQESHDARLVDPAALATAT